MSSQAPALAPSASSTPAPGARDGPIHTGSWVMAEVAMVTGPAGLIKGATATIDGKEYYCGKIIGLVVDSESLRLFVSPDLAANQDSTRILMAKDDSTISVTAANFACAIATENGSEDG